MTKIRGLWLLIYSPSGGSTVVQRPLKEHGWSPIPWKLLFLNGCESKYLDCTVKRFLCSDRDGANALNCRGDYV